MASLSKTIRILAALAMLTTTPVVDAQTMVCGPNGCRVVSGQPVRDVARVASSPVRRVVRSGRFGRRVRYESVPAQAVESYGSTGGYSSWTTTYESAPRYSATTVTKSAGSTGGLPEAPTATIPAACECECECPACGTRFRCNCTQTSSIPSPLPTKGLCFVPPVAVTGTCRVPEPAPSVRTVAGL